MYITPSQLEDALAMSIDDMRMAEQMLRLHGATAVANRIRERADKNMQLILPFVQR